MSNEHPGSKKWRLLYAKYQGWRCCNVVEPPPAPIKQDFERYEDARRALDALRKQYGSELVGTVIPIPESVSVAKSRWRPLRWQKK